MPLAMSPKQAEYFDRIQKQVDEIYDIAKMARSKGLDPFYRRGMSSGIRHGWTG